jgi:signal peptidase I
MIDFSYVLPLKRFILEGHSMEPLFGEGDKVIINKLAYLFTKPKLGDVVAFKENTERGKILLKKIKRGSDNGQYFVVGANKNDSQDSRQFGPIAKSQILGKLLTAY